MKISKKNNLFIGSIIAVLISISPFLLYLHTRIPEEFKSFNTIFGTIGNGGFGSSQVYVYVLLSKFVPLFLLTLLYISNRNWWSHAILIPIATYLFQFISIVFNNNSALDEIEFIYTIPIVAIVLTPLYFIRKKIEIYLQALDLKKEMDQVMDKSKKN